MIKRLPVVLCLLPIALGGTTNMRVSAASPVHNAVVPPVPKPSIEALPAAPEPAGFESVAKAAPDAREVACVAKVIIHEAGNQPLEGRMAVAQVIRTRMEDGRFAKSACAVVKQPGQFFDVDAYHPERSDDRWDSAVELARATLNGEGDDVVPGALFFHAVGTEMPSRTRVGRVAGHVFYR
ncbi:cell wall hydrolase [Sphingomonas pituitosa]|uniref:cell wall hydrolase n=1 Tax=Sphingomonas pituitosa TaxID=99597 RepID=UPI0009FC2E94|nr:cell wall hydrolase [Sphingomonas pituitosa]